MCKIQKIIKLLLLFAFLAKVSEASPKKYDAQADGSTTTEYESEMKNRQTNNYSIPCMSNCGEWRVLKSPHNNQLTLDDNSRRTSYSSGYSSYDPPQTINKTSSTFSYPTDQTLVSTSFVSSNTYPENPWRRNFQKDKTQVNETFSDNLSDRSQRLGYTTGLGSNYGGYSGVNGYGYSGAGVSAYSPYKVDLGGVILGAIVGVGALILIPKVLGVIAGGQGGYGYGAYRNIEELGGVADMMAKLDDFLAKNNVDSTTCMQKAVCHFMRNSSQNSVNGQTNQIEDMILALSDNSIVDYMIDGTAIKEAITNGRNSGGRDCDTIYTNCPLDRDGAMQLVRKFLPFPKA